MIKNEKTQMNELLIQIHSNLNSISLKNKENEETKKKISRIDICPTCLQDVNENYKANVVYKLDSDTIQNDKKIKDLTIEKERISPEIRKMDENILLIDKKIQELNIIKFRVQAIDEKKKRVLDLEKNNNMLGKDILLLESQIDTLKKSVLELNKFDLIFEMKKQELNKVMQEEKAVEIRLAELKKEINIFSIQIEELRDKIEKTEQMKLRVDYLNKLEDWLTNKFISVISSIEKNVMIKLKAEFSQLFSEWFSMLVSEAFNVSLDEDFTPIIEQQDYELDYNYLSGGERTAIALAYRLSLNQVINSLLSKIKTRDLVILDEPTDGFSSAQLDKMRDVLEQLNVSKLIIVSHEQKIEGFVDNVIRLKKQAGVSGKEF